MFEGKKKKKKKKKNDWPYLKQKNLRSCVNILEGPGVLFFSGWCCHGVTTQVFYSENVRYKYHMQSWIWIWYALITFCSDYNTDVVWNPPLLRAVIGLPKCSLARKTRKQPSQTSQKWWAPVWMKDEKIVMQALKCKIVHHKPVHKLEHDILPRDLLQLKHPPHPKQKPSPLPSTNTH